MLGGVINMAIEITLIMIKLFVGFTSMFFVALSIAPSHKREVFKGACVFSAAIAVVIAMMSAADGNPLYTDASTIYKCNSCLWRNASFYET